MDYTARTFLFRFGVPYVCVLIRRPVGRIQYNRLSLLFRSSIRADVYRAVARFCVIFTRLSRLRSSCGDWFLQWRTTNGGKNYNGDSRGEIRVFFFFFCFFLCFLLFRLRCKWTKRFFFLFLFYFILFFNKRALAVRSLSKFRCGQSPPSPPI